METLVSIIIPIYNLEKYVKKSIESALNQSYMNIEVILVDDGSKDNSGVICDAYSKVDSRVRVIHKENGGLVSARKSGLEISRGKYIVPLDADDWIERDMVKSMLSIMESGNIDFAQCGLMWEYYDGSREDSADILREGGYDLKQNANGLYENLFTKYDDKSINGARSNICSCIFKRDIVIKAQSLINDELANGEDDALFFVSMLISNKFYKFEHAYYHSLVRTNSMSRAKNMFNVNQVFMIENIVRPVLRKHEFFEMLEPMFNRYLYNLFNLYATNYWKTGYDRVYMLESELVPYKSKIVLYGAGVVGQSYHLLLSDKYNIVAWIDGKKDYVGDVKIDRIDVIKNISYDYVILAAKKAYIADEMRQLLITMGVKEEQIVWHEPQISAHYYFFPDRN